MENKKQATAEKFRERITNWQSSGKSKMEFCKANGINYQSFLYWIKKIKDAGGENKFQELQVKDVEINSTELLSVCFPNHCVIKIHGAVPVQFLTALVASCK